MIPLNSNLSSLKRSPIRLFTNMARETPGCAMLTIGEPDFDTPANIRAAAVAALQNHHTHYAPNQGTPGLRKAVAEFETNRGNPTKPEQVLITIGACHALFTALLGILNPGEEIIVPTPGFLLYETIAAVAGAKAVPLDISGTGFQIEEAALREKITEKTKAIIINSPGNPTGTVLNRESLEAVKACVLGKPIFVVCDNVYNRLVYGDCPDISLDAALKEQLIYCQSFSKPYAMTGWRIGFVAAPAEIVDRMTKCQENFNACANAPGQYAGTIALEHPELCEELRQTFERRRTILLDGLAKIDGIRCNRPNGAFYVFADISSFGLSSVEFCNRLLDEQKVVCIPGSAFGACGEGFIRIAYTCSDENLHEALRRIDAFCKSL